MWPPTFLILPFVYLQFWMAKTLASAINLAMVSTGATKINLTIPEDIWESMTLCARFNGNANVVAWNPLLVTDDERKSFEAFAASQNFKSGGNAECLMCGSPNRGYANPDDMVEIVGFGLFSCRVVEEGGRKGIVPDNLCESVSYLANQVCQCTDLPPDAIVSDTAVEIPESLWKISMNETVNEPYGNGLYHPMWQMTTRGEGVKNPIMFNEMSEEVRSRALKTMLETEMPVMSETVVRKGYFFEEYTGYIGDTSSYLYYPVKDQNGRIAGSISLDLLWSNFLVGVFPPNSDLVDVVIENSCGQNFTYSVDMELDKLVLLGEGDLHDEIYDNMVFSTSFDDFDMIVEYSSQIQKDGKTFDYCRYRFHVFSSQRFEDNYTTNNPVVYAAISGSVFFFTSLVFVLYDYIVRQRQAKIMNSATKTNDIVVSLFPENVRDRLLERGAAEDGQVNKGGTFIARPQKEQMQSYLTGSNSAQSSEPIADLFACATVCFIDIANFVSTWNEKRCSG